MADRFFGFLVTLGAAAALVSCSGGTSDPSDGSSGSGTSESSINGTWDITSAGGDEVGPSELVIQNGSVTGAIVSTQEGQASGYPGCTYAKYRTEISLSISGDAISGTFTEVRDLEGSDCPKRKADVTPVSGTRSGAAKVGATRLEGSWEVRVGDREPFLLDVEGLTGKAWGSAAEKTNGKSPVVNAVVAGSNATSSSSRERYTFAARKR